MHVFGLEGVHITVTNSIIYYPYEALRTINQRPHHAVPARVPCRAETKKKNDLKFLIKNI